MPWQRQLILELFEIDGNGLRRFRWALWGVPKKQGKTELAAALGLYFLIGDGEPGPLVVCAAASDDQADLVFGAAKTMCEYSPTLDLITECYDKEILATHAMVWNRETEEYDLYENPGAVLKRVAAVAGTNDGQNIHAVICDELHEWVGKKGRNVWTVLTNGVGARRQPMVLQITTAGYDEDTICFEEYDRCKAIESGRKKDRRYHFWWVEADPEADYRKEATWRSCNPSYGITVRADFYRDQIKKKPEAIFRRYFLNQWTSAEEAWLPSAVWKANTEKGLEIPEHAEVFLGVDVGVRQDSSAVTIVHPRESDFAVQTIIKYPPGGNDQNSVLELEIIEEIIRDLANRYTVRGVAYDPWNFERSAQGLSNDGLLMVKYPQSPSRTAPASALLFEAIMTGEIKHDGDAEFTAQVLAGATLKTPTGWRLVKNKSTKPIDSLMALMMAFDTAVNGEIEGVSVYDEKDLVVI